MLKVKKVIFKQGIPSFKCLRVLNSDSYNLRYHEGLQMLDIDGKVFVPLHIIESIELEDVYPKPLETFKEELPKTQKKSNAAR